jgi:hypothetical protein
MKMGFHEKIAMHDLMIFSSFAHYITQEVLIFYTEVV